MNELSFVVNEEEDFAELMPVVDGISMTQLVGDYEAAHAMAPSGAYAGLVHAHIESGGLTTYYFGQSDRQSPGTGRMWLLGCDCGEAGCWPLEVTTTVADGRVTWTNFRQPYRPGWDYTGFGPFTFEEAQYRDAIAGAESAVLA